MKNIKKLFFRGKVESSIQKFPFCVMEEVFFVEDGKAYKITVTAYKLSHSGSNIYSGECYLRKSILVKLPLKFKGKYLRVPFPCWSVREWGVHFASGKNYEDTFRNKLADRGVIVNPELRNLLFTACFKKLFCLK